MPKATQECGNEPGLLTLISPATASRAINATVSISPVLGPHRALFPVVVSSSFLSYELFSDAPSVSPGLLALHRHFFPSSLQPAQKVPLECPCL